LECLSLCWHAPLRRDHAGYCTAEVGNPGGTYELPYINRKEFKIKFFLVHAMKAFIESEIVPPVILNLLKPSEYFTSHQVLTFKNSTWCSHCVCIFCTISQQTASFPLQNINRLVLRNRGWECLLRGTD